MPFNFFLGGSLELVVPNLLEISSINGPTCSKDSILLSLFSVKSSVCKGRIERRSFLTCEIDRVIFRSVASCKRDSNLMQLSFKVSPGTGENLSIVLHRRISFSSSDRPKVVSSRVMAISKV